MVYRICAKMSLLYNVPLQKNRKAYQHSAKIYTSREHAYIMLTPLEPHFYTVKLGFTGVYIIFLFLLKT